MTDSQFRERLKSEVLNARKSGLSDDEISLALSGALVAVKCDSYRLTSNSN